jgi:dihydropteroate synthase
MSALRLLLEKSPSVLVMGILNRTPDSFSDGGEHFEERAAHERVRVLLTEGADLIDVGAESTRPGAPPVADDEQIARIGGLIRECAARGVIVSIDTTSPRVAAWALAEGASAVNSVSLEPAAELGRLAARHGAALVLMHSRGSMEVMRGYSTYDDDAYGDVVADVAREWSAAADRAIAAGLPREALILDPGLGFAKNARHSLELCARLRELTRLGFPVLVGPSRKSFIAVTAGRRLADGAWPPPSERLGGTIAVTLACIARGASIVRVHDVAALRQAISVSEALGRVPAPSEGPAEVCHA